jgi:GGDEF domain-containing protein
MVPQESNAPPCSTPPRLLDQLVSLTGIRDLELLEASLLKTLNGFIQHTGLSLYKVSSRVYELHPPDDECPVAVEHRKPQNLTTYWIAMIDIDHFKSVNDRFGHLNGDEVLSLLAHLLKNALRNDDLVFRFVGEELVLMIRCESREEAAVLWSACANRRRLRTFPRWGRSPSAWGPPR